MNKKVVGGILGAVLLFALPFGLVNLLSDSAKAENASSIFVANVSSVLSQSVGSCGTVEERTVSLANSGATGGSHFSSCYIVVRNTTNAPGYSLMIQSIDGPRRSTVDSNNKWNYDVNGDGAVDGSDNYAIPYGDGAADGDTKLMKVIKENTPPTLPDLGTDYIAPTSAAMLTPAEMNASVSPYQSAWGFAVPRGQAGTAPTNFDSSYSTFSSSSGSSHGKYAKVPTSASTIRATAAPAANDSTNVFFGVSVSPTQPTGIYKGTVVFTAVTNPITEPAPMVLAIYPDNGLPAGGTTVDIYGSFFVGTTSVTIGGTTCGSVKVISSSHLTCVVPAKAVGSYSVVVTTVYGQSNSNVVYTYTASPTPDPNPYNSTDDLIRGFAAQVSGGQSGSDGDGSIDPQGRSVFENLAEAVGNDDYSNMWLAIGSGALLACLLVLLSVLLGRRWDIYITEELGDNRAEVVKILVEKVGLDAKEVVESLQTIPSLAVEGVSKGDAKKILELLEDVDAEVELVRHGRKPDDEKTDEV